MGQVNVYDTVYSDIDYETMELIRSMTEVTEISLVQGLPKQGGVDCGVLAIAIPFC